MSPTAISTRPSAPASALRVRIRARSATGRSFRSASGFNSLVIRPCSSVLLLSGRLRLARLEDLLARWHVRRLRVLGQLKRADVGDDAPPVLDGDLRAV